MTEGEHTDDRTQKRGAQSVPRFIVVLGIVGVVALVAALVAVVVMQGTGSTTQTSVDGAAEESSSGPGADDSGGTGAAEETTGVGVGPGGPSAAELAAQSAGDLGAPAELCGEGVELPVLDAPPPSTLGLVALPAGFEVAELDVTFSPYGWGQGGPEGCNLVITRRHGEARFRRHRGLGGHLRHERERVDGVRTRRDSQDRWPVRRYS